MDYEPLKMTAKCSFERSGNITINYAESESLKFWYVRRWCVYRLTQLGNVYISFILATCFGPLPGYHQAYVTLYNCTFSLIVLHMAICYTVYTLV
jgi:outer membrane receptor for monomeric catechols